MTESDMTPWFGEDAPPVRQGVYQVDVDKYAYWDGKNWGMWDDTPDKAVAIYDLFGAYCRTRIWRGLIANPQLDLFDNVGDAPCPQPDLFASA